jgi:UDP-N-acetylmuramyl pentapeptide phosphotransferase/UDP-N-acetylglucosamine-1-phosphate transferase
MKFLPLIFIFITIYLINNFFFRKNLLLNYSGQVHQMFTGIKKVPLTGGIFILIFSSIIFFKLGYLYVIFIFLIFLIGLLSDLNFITSVKIRFLVQLLIVGIFVYILEISIGSTRILYLDLILTNKTFSLVFTIFCLMIVINGSNFIDGLNGLVLGYYISVFGILIKLNLFQEINIDNFTLIYFGSVLIYLYFLNILHKLFLGDSGAYLFGLVFGILLIKIYQQDQIFSPFFIVLLLWMPCFENLFSIIRKFFYKIPPTSPDNNHFHQLIFLFVKNSFKIKNSLANNYSSLIIIFYNLIVFYLGSINIYNTKYQMLLITVNIVIYLLVYKILFKYKHKKSAS